MGSFLGRFLQTCARPYGDDETHRIWLREIGCLVVAVRPAKNDMLGVRAELRPGVHTSGGWQEEEAAPPSVMGNRAGCRRALLRPTHTVTVNAGVVHHFHLSHTVSVMHSIAKRNWSIICSGRLPSPAAVQNGGMLLRVSLFTIFVHCCLDCLCITVPSQGLSWPL